MFTRGLSYIASFSFMGINFTCGLTEKLRDSGNQPLEKDILLYSVDRLICNPKLQKSYKLIRLHPSENINIPYSFAYKVQPFFNESLLDISKSIVISGCIL